MSGYKATCRAFVVALVLIFTTVRLAQAQETLIEKLSLDHWGQGTVTFNSGATVEGKVNYDYTTGIVRVQREGRTERYADGMVSGIEVDWFNTPEKARFLRMKVGPAERIYRVLYEGSNVAFLSYFEIDTWTQTPAEPSNPYLLGIRMLTSENNNQEVIYINQVKEVFMYVTPNEKSEIIGTLSLVKPVDTKEMVFKSDIQKKQVARDLDDFNANLLSFIKKQKLNLEERADILKLLKAAVGRTTN